MFRVRKKIKRNLKEELMVRVHKDVRKVARSVEAAHHAVDREDHRDKVDGSKGRVSNRTTGRVRVRVVSAGHRVRMDHRKEGMEIASRVMHHAGLANMEIKGRVNTDSRIKGHVNMDSVPAVVVDMHHARHVRLDKIANGVVEAVRVGLMVKDRRNHGNTEDKAVLTVRVVDKAVLTIRDKAADMDRTVRSARVRKASDRIATEAAHRIANQEIATARLHKARANMAVVLVDSRTCIPRTFARNATVVATNRSSHAPAASTHPRRAVRVDRRTIPSGTGNLN